MARLTTEQLENIKQKYNVNRIWSWSRINIFMTSPYEYYLKYVIKAKEDRTDCCYTTLGTICHDTLDNYYENKIPYEKMIDNFEDGWLTAIEIADLKFDRNDETKNSNIARKYKTDLQHFFKNHTKYKYPLSVEKPVVINVDNNIFVGYIDAIYKDDDVYHIIDFKTSTQYTGKNLTEHSGQLVLYALGLHQAGIPLDKIHIKFNFLKYVTVQLQQKKKDSPPKYRDIERSQLGEKLKANVTMWLKDAGYAPEDINNYISDLIIANDISVLPKEIQDKYVIQDCHTDIPLTEELINYWIETIKSTITDIELREKDYEEVGNDNMFFDTEESVKSQSYYFATLCGYSGNLHKPYQRYLNKLDEAKNGGGVFSGVGNNTDNNEDFVKNGNDVKIVCATDKNIDNIDLSWLDNLS
ncbi:MAG: PD-(D/E)XK nuclease family protein [Clostridia bacterium]|nr:PD-(D/E)XK nuclease family protein [Clostridia bacterium]